jgi:hypothetical protein
MNNDLISRSELKKAIQKLEEEPDYQHEGETWQNGLCMAEILIDNAPTVEFSKEICLVCGRYIREKGDVE